MKFFMFILFFICHSVVFAQSSKNVEDFDALSIAGNFDINLVHSNDTKVDIVSSNVDNEDIEIENDGSKLKIRFKSNTSKKNEKAKLTIYYSELSELSAAASAHIHGEDVISADDFQLDASSGSHVSVSLKVSNLDVDASSGAHINVSGSASGQQVDVSSGAHYNGIDLVTSTSDVDASSGAHVKVHATSSLEAEASSGASIKYTGSPAKIDKESSSGGSIGVVKS